MVFVDIRSHFRSIWDLLISVSSVVVVMARRRLSSSVANLAFF
jgi:hypothetical protein